MNEIIQRLFKRAHKNGEYKIILQLGIRWQRLRRIGLVSSGFVLFPWLAEGTHDLQCDRGELDCFSPQSQTTTNFYQLLYFLVRVFTIVHSNPTQYKVQLHGPHVYISSIHFSNDPFLISLHESLSKGIWIFCRVSLLF